MCPSTGSRSNAVRAVRCRSTEAASEIALRKIAQKAIVPEQTRRMRRHLADDVPAGASVQSAVQACPMRGPIDELRDQIGHEVADDQDRDRRRAVPVPTRRKRSKPRSTESTDARYEHVALPRLGRSSMHDPLNDRGAALVTAGSRSQTSRSPCSVSSGSTRRDRPRVRRDQLGEAARRDRRARPGAPSSSRIRSTIASTWPAKP